VRGPLDRFLSRTEEVLFNADDLDVPLRDLEFYAICLSYGISFEARALSWRN
jgi:hypothetical protein